MPGLLSVIDFHQRADLVPRFERARSVLVTGPGFCSDAWRDGAGIVALGRVDNGILNPAPQPIASPDGRYRVFFQGELYDRQAKLAELKARDLGLSGEDSATLLLATYLTAGLTGVGRLNGSYFFLLWDDATQMLIVGGDRHANRPHYYALDEERFLLAPEARAVAAACTRPPGVDLTGLAEFLALEHPLADHTFYEGVRAFPGGTFLTLTRAGTRWEVYWTLSFTAPDEEQERPAEAWLPEAAHLLRQAVGRQLDDKSGLFLSGGTDSRLILAAAPHRAMPAVTFGTPESEDVRYAADVAKLAGVTHHVLPMRADFLSANAAEILARGEGMSSLFHAHNCEGLHAVRAIAPVMLAGNTSLFLRTEYYNDVMMPDAPSKAARAVQVLQQLALGHPPRRRFASEEQLIERMVVQCWTAVPPAIARQVLAPELVSEIERALREGIAAQFARVKAPALADRLIAYNIVNRQRRFTHWSLAMTSHVHEFRKPFDDYDLVDFVLALPHGTRR
ncbi:MAG TPA: asparagine synthase-related protein, partial [Oscillatoriaceae cyanobacterium]